MPASLGVQILSKRHTLTPYGFPYHSGFTAEGEKKVDTTRLRDFLPCSPITARHQFLMSTEFNGIKLAHLRDIKTTDDNDFAELGD